MSFRNFYRQLDALHLLRHVDKSVSKKYEAAGVIKALEPEAILFSSIEERQIRAAGGLFSSKEAIARFYGLQPKDLIPAMVKAIQNPTPSQIVTKMQIASKSSNLTSES